jgi:hypothetical protein
MSEFYTSQSKSLRTAGFWIAAACGSTSVFAHHAQVPTASDASLWVFSTSARKSSAYEAIRTVDHLALALGVRGIERLRHLKTLKDGWDGANAKALDERSIELARRFFDTNEIAPNNLAVFFTTDGYLSLGWEDREGQDVEVDFSLDTVSAYFDGSGEELAANIEKKAEIDQLVAKIKETL